MAFGAAAERLEAKSKKKGDGETAAEQYVSPYMPNGSGIRTFRWLPRVDDDGVAVLTDRLSVNGTPLREGNKKGGKILQGMEPADEFAFLFAWWQVMVDGALKPRRIHFHVDNRWNNPLWKHIQENFTKDSPEWKVFKTAFAANVFDMSPVLTGQNGALFYQSEGRKFDLIAYGPSGKIMTDGDKLPTADPDEAKPLNQVRVLEGSYGARNGKHLFAQFVTLADSVENNDGILLRLPEFTMRLKTTGKELTTVRTVLQTADFKPLGNDVIALPRFDLAEMFKPWPDQAVQDLIDLRDFNEVLTEYGISTAPVMKSFKTEETANVEEELFT